MAHMHAYFGMAPAMIIILNPRLYPFRLQIVVNLRFRTDHISAK